MHEVSLIRALLRQVSELQTAQRGRELRRIDVSVGEFCGADPDLLQSAFGQSTRGTPLAGVEFSVARVPLTARCRNCHVEFQVQGFRFVCPVCAGRANDVTRGEELMLESLTFEETA